MATIPEFEKDLTDADINHRLSFPTKYLHMLPSFADGSNEARFDVRYGDEEHPYAFFCIKRKTGSPKPTIDRGWSDVVRDNQLQIGDRLKFYVEGGEQRRYRIEVWRPQYSDNYGVTWIPM